jgi:hypothetical protein
VVEEVVVDGIVVDEIVELIVVEAVIDEVTEETEVVPGDPTLDESVDELFARIRAGRAEEVANAEDILADPPAGSLGETAALSEENTKESSEPDVFDQRAAALARSRRRWPASCAGCSLTSRTRCSTGSVRAASFPL